MELCPKCHGKVHLKLKYCEYCKQDKYRTRIIKSICKRACPDCYKKTITKKKEERKNRWSIKYSECIECGIKKSKNCGGGRCQNCYKKNYNKYLRKKE